MGKNILNRFRQDNGYKEKKYTKIWNGQEDNVYLMHVIDQLMLTDDNFEEIIYDALTEKYKTITKEQ